jgi:hypothetical protein
MHGSQYVHKNVYMGWWVVTICAETVAWQNEHFMTIGKGSNVLGSVTCGYGGGVCCCVPDIKIMDLRYLPVIH